MARNPLASLPGLPQRPSLARSSASETRLTQPGIEGARRRKLNSAPTAAFRIIARMAPKKYGDKQALEHSGPDGGPMEVAAVTYTDADRAKALADFIAIVCHLAAITRERRRAIRLERAGEETSMIVTAPRDAIVLRNPFLAEEAITVSEAAKLAGRTGVTVRSWASRAGLGRPVGGQWLVSKVALAMFLENDLRALKAYWAGDRESPIVTSYFDKVGVKLKKSWQEKKEEKEAKERCLNGIPDASTS